MSLYVGPPRRGRQRRFSSARSVTHASMSTSIWSVKSGIVAFDSAIRRAIVCWVRVSSTTVVSPLAVATPRGRPPGAAPVRRAGAASAGRAGRLAPSTSALTIRPPGPLPVSARRSTPLSRAIRLASGEALTRSPAGRSRPAPCGARLPAGRYSLRRSLAGVRHAGAGARPAHPRLAAVAVDVPARRHRRRVRSARRPRACRPRRRPARGRPPGRTRRSWSPCRSRSRRAPRRGAPARRRLEPAQDRALLHRVRQPRHDDRRPSAGPGPGVSRGRAARPARSGLVRVGDVLERLGVGHRHVGAGDPRDRRVEVVEGLLGDQRREVRADAAVGPALLDDHTAVGLGAPRRGSSRGRAAAVCAGRSPRPRTPCSSASVSAARSAVSAIRETPDDRHVRALPGDTRARRSPRAASSPSGTSPRTP